MALHISHIGDARTRLYANRSSFCVGFAQMETVEAAETIGRPFREKDYQDQVQPGTQRRVVRENYLGEPSQARLISHLFGLRLLSHLFIALSHSSPP